MANTIATTNRPDVFSFEFLKILMRGTGQVMFQNSARTGLLFMAGIFWGAYWEGQGLAAWGALAGVAVSTLTGYWLRLPASDGARGLWGFNGALVGCAFPTFMGNTVWMWLALVLCSALTTWVRTGFNNVMAPWKVNSLTFPFVFCTWMFLLAARALHGLPTTHMSDPALPAAFSAAGNIGLGHLIVYWLKGIAQVFLIDNWVTGILFLAGLWLSNRRAALWAAVGSALALLTALVFKASGADIAEGLYGFSAVLTAIALATVFYEPNVRSAVWAVLGIVVTLFIQAGMNTLLDPVGIATLTGPFCVATWLFLLPLIRFDDTEKPDHSNWNPENKRHLAQPQSGPKPNAAPRSAANRKPGGDSKPGADPKTGARPVASEHKPKPDRNRRPDKQRDARRTPKQSVNGQNTESGTRRHPQPDVRSDARHAAGTETTAGSAPKPPTDGQSDVKSAPKRSETAKPNK